MSDKETTWKAWLKKCALCDGQRDTFAGQEVRFDDHDLCAECWSHGLDQDRLDKGTPLSKLTAFSWSDING